MLGVPPVPNEEDEEEEDSRSGEMSTEPHRSFVRSLFPANRERDQEDALEVEMTERRPKEEEEGEEEGKSFIPIIKVHNFIGQLSNHLSVLFGLFRRN